jgi:hypothetical protein
MLPRSVRRQLWLPVPPAVEPLVVRPAATVLVRAVGWVMAGYPSGPAADRGDAPAPAPAPAPAEATRPGARHEAAS